MSDQDHGAAHLFLNTSDGLHDLALHHDVDPRVGDRAAAWEREDRVHVDFPDLGDLFGQP